MNIENKIKLLDFKLSKNLGSNLFGIYKTAFHGNGIDFAEHKEYIFGDNIKDIDWKATAKTGNMFVKKYEEDRDLNVLFLIDVSSSMDFGSQDKTKREIQEELFYSLAFSALQNDDNIGGFIYSDEILDFIPMAKGPKNIFRILDLIEKNKPKTNNKNTLKIIEHINKLNIRKSLIFILTDDMNFKNESILKVAGNENDIILINIFDSFENDLILDKVNISLNLGNDFFNLDLGNIKKIEEYRFSRLKKLNYLENLLKKSRIGYINIDNKKNLYKELIGYFSKI